MEWGISFWGDLQKMREKMDRAWSDLIEKNLGREEETARWVERLPKFEGIGRRTLKVRADKTVKP